MVDTFLAVITYPLVRLLKKNRFSRGMAIFLTVSFVLGLLGGFLWLLGDSADRFREVMPDHIENLSTDFNNWLASHQISDSTTDLTSSLSEPLVEILGGLAGGIASAISNLLVWSFS